MKKKDLTDFKNKRVEELKKLVEQKKMDLNQFLFKKISGGEKNVKKSRNLKKDIAQLLTIIRENENI